jgi:NTE family protein
MLDFRFSRPEFSLPLSLPPSALDGVEMFADLSAEDRARLGAELKVINLQRGDVLMAQGAPADAMFVTVSGRFSVTVAERAAPVAELGPGQPVGEIAFLAGGTRTATVTALRDSVVLSLGRTEFDDLAARQPSIWRALSRALARRVAAGNVARAAPPDPLPRTITLIRAGSSAMPKAFVEGLVAEFRRGARVAVMGAAIVPDVMPPPGDAATAEVTHALNALEQAHDFVLFLADDTLTPWSEKAIHQADLVLAVGQHHANATPNALERRVAELHAPGAVRLVLTHARREPISDTRRWLAQRQVSMHHHVALREPDDIARVFRFVTGRALGFVACGGGAYCAAHIGIYRALTEAGVRFDIMGGTSGGSAMTAAFVMGSTPDALDAAVDDIFVANAAMRRYTVPRYALLDHTHFDAQLARHYGGVAIEDLWLPFFAVSTDLSRNEVHAHRDGSVLMAVRASASIPVLLPPVYTDDGRMLVDGALLDNVPVRVMRDLKSGPNVVVNFTTPADQRFAVRYEDLPDRASLVKAMLNPFARGRLPPAPGLAAVLMRAMMANRADFARHMGPDDLLLVPQMPADMGPLHWHRHRELAGLAYAWTKAEIDRARETGHPLMAGLPRP